MIVEILTVSNILTFIIEAGMLIVAIVVMNMTNRKAIEDKYNLKADKEKVDCIELEVKKIQEKKADVDYVKELNRAVHYRIDEHNTHIIGVLNQLQSNQDVMMSDIKDLLKRRK
jgi:cysteinyl-tRNA synthetase